MGLPALQEDPAAWAASQRAKGDDVILPQEQQDKFLRSPADIVIGGGGAGGGKSFADLLACLRDMAVKGFGAVIFRRILPSIMNEGGLWDEAKKLFPRLGASYTKSPRPQFTFSNGNKVTFAHLEHDDTVSAYDSSQIPLIIMDQGEEFSEYQFWYMTSRNRTTCGVKPQFLMTVNPHPTSFLVCSKEGDFSSWGGGLISWWIDEDGDPIPERDGVIRYFARINGKLHWGDSKDELLEGETGEVIRRRAKEANEKAGREIITPERLIKSITFIRLDIEKNLALMAENPDYLADLENLPEYERKRLRKGNWKSRPEAGEVFDREDFVRLRFVDPSWIKSAVRVWDKAATEGGGCATSGVKLLRLHKDEADPGRPEYVFVDRVKGHWSWAKREKIMKTTAKGDGKQVWQGVEKEGAASGIESAERTVQNMSPYVCKIVNPTGSKLERAIPLATQVKASNVGYLDDGSWEASDFLDSMHLFTGVDDKKKTRGKHGLKTVVDDADAAAHAFNLIHKFGTAWIH